jgi:hypothetical protein
MNHLGWNSRRMEGYFTRSILGADPSGIVSIRLSNIRTLTFCHNFGNFT